MALERRSATTVTHRNPDYNGGGDQLKLKEDLLQMCEHQSFVGELPNRYFGGSIGNRELAAMTLFGVALYMVNGEHAQAVCTGITSVPPAMFSYRVLNNEATDKKGYHSILFYWTIYGLLALTDQFVGSAELYNLCKCALLLIFFLHAVRSNLSAIPATWLRLLAEHQPTILSSWEPTLRKISFDPSSPTMSQFSEDDSLEYIFPMNSAMEMSTACSFPTSMEMQSTQNMSPGDVRHSRTSDASSVQTAPQYYSMSAMTMTVDGIVGDIVTVPAERVTFSMDQRETLIRVTNVSPVHLMFALKTNADTHLIAAPTAGVLFSGQSVTMRVGVTDSQFSGDPITSIDKLAIDYTPIPPELSNSFANFSPTFFHSQPRRRHAIRVFYQ